MENREYRKGRTERPHSTSKVFEEVDDAVEGAEINKPELGSEFRISFKLEDDPRTPESHLRFSEDDQFIDMELYFPMSTDREEIEEEVERLESVVEEKDAPECTQVEVTSDQGEQVFRPLIKIDNADWISCDEQILEITDFLTSFFQDFNQEEDGD
jgi:hypothetical protein